ncbi:MAG: hypothetical protein DDG60_05075 [Anaerolineae bacterium]|nr:MAG: hypothetical protein DDG60_05075 [Anaerolineae bacterium]
MNLKRISVMDWLAILVILAAGLKFVWGMEADLDIGLYDESVYLYTGVKLPTLGLPPAQAAPLYAVWYFILSWFVADRVHLYYVNHQLMIILPAMLVYALLRRNRVSIPISLAVAWLFLVSRGNPYTWPKVSHFGLIVALVTFLAISYKQTALLNSAIASVGALFVSYVRPEYFVVYLLLVCVFLGLLIYQWRATKQIPLVPLVLYGLVSIVVIPALGIPVQGTRSMIAFGQHFALNWVAWTGSDLNPWTNWKEIVSQHFGAVASVGEAAWNNPGMFLQHVAYNLRKTLNVVLTAVLPVFFPTDLFSKSLVMVFFVGLFAFSFEKVRENFRVYRAVLFLLWLFPLPGVISTILIYPREHYLLMVYSLLAVSFTVLVGANAASQTDTMVQKRAGGLYQQLVLVGLLIVALTPYFRVNRGQPNLQTIRFIQALNIQRQVNLLEADGGYAIYLGDHFQRVPEYEKNVSFFQYLQKKEVGMIVLSNLLSNDARFDKDEEWHQFLSDSSRYGFVRFDIPNTKRAVFVRADILEK